MHYNTGVVSTTKQRFVIPVKIQTENVWLVLPRHGYWLVAARGIWDSSVQIPEQDPLVIPARYHEAPVITELHSVHTAVVSQKVLSVRCDQQHSGIERELPTFLWSSPPLLQRSLRNLSCSLCPEPASLCERNSKMFLITIYSSWDRVGAILLVLKIGRFSENK